jgi:HPt (histidine-containing phosphotransfer) domain-containing protein
VKPEAGLNGEAALPKSLPGIDIASGLKRVGGNQELFLKLLSEFRLKHSQTVDKIRQALAEGDSNLAERLAHTIKGVSGNMGANDLPVAAHAVEMGIKKGKTSDIEGTLEQLTFTLEEVLASIASLEHGEDISTPAGEKPQDEDAVVNIAEVKPMLIELAALIKENDMEAADRLETLRKHLEDAVLPSVVTKLEKRLGQYDFEGALLCLTEMAQLLAINVEEENDEQ